MILNLALSLSLSKKLDLGKIISGPGLEEFTVKYWVKQVRCKAP